MVDVNPAPRPAPALSATSDMPQITPPPKPAETPPPDPAKQTVGEALGKKMPADDAKPVETPAETKPAEGEGEKPVEAEAKPTEPEKPDPAITERALKGEVTKYKNRHAAADARATAAEARANEVQQQLTTALDSLKKLSESAAATGKAEQTADPRPKRETFDNPDAYDTALEDWSRRQAVAAAKAEFQQQQEQQRQADEAQAKKDADEKKARQWREERNKIAQAWQERREKFIEQHPDFAEVAETSAVPISGPGAVLLGKIENGPAVAYYLGQNPDIAKEIASHVIPGEFFPPGHEWAGQPVPDMLQLALLGGISQQLKAASRPVASKAPPPIKPIGSQAAAAPKSLDAMSGDEYYNAVKNDPRHARRRAGPLSN